MNRRAAAFAVALFVLVVPRSLSAVGYTITKGTLNFTRTTYGSAPAANFTGVSPTLTQDHIFHTGWWYRLGADFREYPFPNPDLEEVTPGHALVTWNDVDGRGILKIVEASQLFDKTSQAVPAGYLFIVLEITNLSGSPITLDLFHYLDLDLDDSNSDDAAVFVQKTPNEIIEVKDAGSDFAQYSAWPLTWLKPLDLHHRIQAYSGLESALDDTDVDNLLNTGSPFGPGDFSAGYQFSYVIPAHGYTQAEIEISIDNNTRCGYDGSSPIFCDGFETADHLLWGP